MNNLFEERNGKRIIKDTKFFMDKYIPSKIVGRKKEIDNISYQLSYFFRENPSLPNLFIYGYSGTGKSLTTSYILNEFLKVCKNKEKKIKIIKLKGSEQKTKYEIFKKIHFEIFGKKTIARDTSELYNSLLEKIYSSNLALIIFIDEIHEIKETELNQTIYTISRINEDLRFYKPRKTLNNFTDCIIGYIFISNDPNIKTKLKSNTRSALYSEDIVFKKYMPEEIKNIIEERIKEGALKKEAISKEGISKISAFASKEGGDARYGLMLLKTSAMESEKKGEDKISIKTIDNSNNYLRKNLLKEIILDIPYTSLDILYHIYLLSLDKKENGITTGEVYNFYQKTTPKNPLSLSRISQIISELDNCKIISTTSSNSKGRTRQIFIEETFEVIEEVLKERKMI